MSSKLSKEIKDGEAKNLKQKEEAFKNIEKMSQSLALDVVKKIGLKEVSNSDINSALKKVANN